MNGLTIINIIISHIDSGIETIHFHNLCAQLHSNNMHKSINSFVNSITEAPFIAWKKRKDFHHGIATVRQYSDHTLQYLVIYVLWPLQFECVCCELEQEARDHIL